MATVAQTKLLTAEEFMAADLGEGRFELVRGEVVRSAADDAGAWTSLQQNQLDLGDIRQKSGYGYCLSDDSAVSTERGPDTVRGPDICFYSHARWPEFKIGTGLPPVPPDLAVEVVSPSNRPGEIQRKVAEYLEAGVLLVWVVDPSDGRVALYRQGEVLPTILSENDVLENLPELPGFRCPVADFFV